MLRKLILAWVLVTGSVVGLSATSLPAHAGEPAKVQFQVLVQSDSGWQLRGSYTTQAEARQVAQRLWQEGHRVLIQQVKVGREK